MVADGMAFRLPATTIYSVFHREDITNAARNETATSDAMIRTMIVLNRAERFLRARYSSSRARSISRSLSRSDDRRLPLICCPPFQ